jgi:hypothetical protein
MTSDEKTSKHPQLAETLEERDEEALQKASK